MWSTIFESVFTLLVALFIWRFLAGMIGRSKTPGGPDDYANVPARLRPRPKSGAGAVALEEPDEDDEAAS